MGTAKFTPTEEGQLAQMPFAKLDVGNPGLAVMPGTITLSASYATAGDTLDLSAYLAAAASLIILGGAKGAYLVEWVPGTLATNQKIKASSAHGTEVSSTTDLSAVTIPCWVVGPRL